MQEEIIVSNDPVLSKKWKDNVIANIFHETNATRIDYECKYNFLGETILYVILQNVKIKFKFLVSRAIVELYEKRLLTTDIILGCIGYLIVHEPTHSETNAHERTSFLVCLPNHIPMQLMTTLLTFQSHIIPHELKLTLSGLTLGYSIKNKLIKGLFERNKIFVFKNDEELLYLMIKHEGHIHKVRLSKIVSKLTQEEFFETLDDFTFYSGISNRGYSFFSVGMPSGIKFSSIKPAFENEHTESLDKNYRLESMESVPRGLSRRLSQLTFKEALEKEIVSSLTFDCEQVPGKVILIIDGFKALMPNAANHLTLQQLHENLSLFTFCNWNAITGERFHITHNIKCDSSA